MPEIIQDWLGTRLGILLDLSPGKFGRNTKDGVLLAQLLYSYGVIPVHVFEKIKVSKNYFDCYKNFTVLRPWLEHIGVKQDNASLQEVARGEGTSAISLFYAVYLNLERKDRLFYLSAQKERRFSENSCRRKFKVDWVPEASLKSPVDSDVIMPDVVNAFSEKRDMIDWHKFKCQEVVEKIKKIKMRFSKVARRKDQPKLRPVISKFTTSQQLDKNLMEVEEVNETIAAFEKRHPQKNTDLTYSELLKLKNMYEVQPCLSFPSMEKARNILNSIKHRKKSEVYARNFQENMQNMVFDEEWKEISKRQNNSLEEAVTKTLLKQSQYEKQMASKLFQIRNRKKIFAENRNFIECLKMEQESREFDDILTAKMEFKREFYEDEEFQKERLMQLHKRVYEEKVRARRELLKTECWAIIYSIIDIAIRISDIRELTSCQVPKALMKDLKELFFKNLPIFDILNNFEELFVNDAIPREAMGEESEEGEEIDYADFSFTRMKNEERERQSTLNETDFIDYMQLLGPWMGQLLFPDGTETETQQLVLGYIVHKLLEVKYPVPNHPRRVPIKPMKHTAVVQYVEGDAYKMLVDLMECCKILVVHVDDAINFVLSAYKEALSVVRDIDIAFQKLTEKALREKPIVEKEKESKKKIQLLKKEETENLAPVVLEPNFLEKETQTPRVIPEDDPVLSLNAEIGKIAFEALGAGDPVRDNVIISAIVAYVSSKQDDYDGWILVNYPQLYIQASDLECALTGYRLMPISHNTVSLEDVEGFSYREPCVDPFSRDDFSQNRLSRLVSKPSSESLTLSEPATYFDLFVKMKKMTDSGKGQSGDLSTSPSPVEQFYTEQKIFCICEYLTLNFQTMKNLAKTILKENTQMSNTKSNTDLVPKTSLEIFGTELTNLNEKWDSGKKKAGRSSAKGKRLSREVTKFPIVKMESKSDEISKMVEKKSTEGSHSISVKPGDPNWEWATGDQPKGLLLALASVWENMEAAFIEDLKDFFFSLRTHRSNVLSYCGFIKKSVQNVMRQPDEKQKVLGDFQQMFNEIDEDLRPDVDIKCELHVRVTELEEALLGIADQRRDNSLKDVTKVTQDGWVADEMANLVNLFLSVVQLEADRSVSTCQVVMDYYTSIQQKIPDEKPIGKISVAKLHVKDRKYSIQSSSSPYGSSSSQLYTPKNSDLRRTNRSLSDQVTKSNFERASKSRSWADKRRKNSDASFLAGATEVIRDILINLSFPDDGMTPFHTFFKESVQIATNEITSMIEGYMSEVKKDDKAVTKNAKKGSESLLPPTAGNAIAEWETALDNELSRFLFRMKLILARGIYDMNEFLATILNTLSALTEDINEMYMKEVESISQCCKIFRCSIEEEIPIQYQLELKEDEFYVNEDVLLLSAQEETSEAIVDREQTVRFSVEQLFLLFEKLRRVAPDGEIIKRSLLFILEDLRALNPEIKTSDCFPVIWKCLEPEDMVTVLNEIYQDLEIVNWKDFIIYALEDSAPTEEEILAMRKQFRELDPRVSELIIREDYDKICFWFDTDSYSNNMVDRNEKVKDLLFKMYQVDDYQTNYSAMLLAFCKDENPIYGFTKALSLVMGKKITTNEYSTKEDYLSISGEGGRLENDEIFQKYGTNSVKDTYCCLSDPKEVFKKCIPKDKITRCLCSDTRESVVPQEDETSLTETYGETTSLFYYENRQTDRDFVISAVPYHILSSLLKASFPSLSQLSALLDCKETFQDTLNSLYDSLESRDDEVQVYKLLRHKFIYRLIQSTNKFRFIKLRQILKNLLKDEKMSSRSFCYLENLNYNFLLD